MKNNEIIEIDGKHYRVELHEVKIPTYEDALEVVKPEYWADPDIFYKDKLCLKGNVPTEKDALAIIALRKLMVLAAYYNQGQEATCWVVFDSNVRFNYSKHKDLIGLKDAETAKLFIENHKDLLNQFYQL